MLVPPKVPPQKSKRPQKARTFSSKKPTHRDQNSKVNQLSTLVKNAVAVLQANGITMQASPFPLAIAQMNGDMRKSQKSLFREALISHNEFTEAFVSTCPLHSSPPSDLCLIIDLLYYFHMPPPPEVITFSQYSTFIWDTSVRKYGLHNKSKFIYLVIDKPDFLPPPRVLVHQSRAKATQESQSLDPEIGDEQPIPHDRAYTALLTSSETFKQKLLKYLSTKMLQRSLETTTSTDIEVVIDTPSFTQPALIKSGTVHRQSPNQHGEGDYAVWHHAIHTSSQHIVIISSDTDTWTYGLGLQEAGHLRDKIIFVQRGNSGEYVDIQKASHAIANHPKLQTIRYPVTSVVAIYVLSGCDYVSSFYGCSKKKFLDTMLDNITYICDLPTNSLVTFSDTGTFNNIDLTAWMKLICAVYFSKHKGFFRNRAIYSVHDSMVAHPDLQENQQLLSWVGCPPQHHIRSLKDWHSFLQKTTFHANKVTQYHEQKLLPSWEALTNHCKRATYVMKLVFSVSDNQCPILSMFATYGWKSSSNGIELEWDNDISESASKCSCSGVSGCQTNRCSCFRQSKACSARCKCKNCVNSTGRYLESDDSGEESDSDEEDDPAHLTPDNQEYESASLDTDALM